MMATLRAGALLTRRYRLVDPIGAGGMSVIWRARDELLDRMVAIKVLTAELAGDAKFRDLVREEARAAAQLVHPHVTAVHDYGEVTRTDGSITAFVVMELLCGEQLESRLTGGPLPWQEAVEVCAQVAGALAAAHRLGIVHRDVTPANIMLTANGAKVLDFGIATRIGSPDEDEEGDTFGTPAYVAPERLDGGPAQPATDTYSLGVLLFEALTGRVPYPAETWDDLTRAQPGGPMPPLEVPGLPAAVVDICRRCLSRDPRHRPTAHQVSEALREHLAQTDPHATLASALGGVPRALSVAGAGTTAVPAGVGGRGPLLRSAAAPVGYRAGVAAPDRSTGTGPRDPGLDQPPERRGPLAPWRRRDDPRPPSQRGTQARSGYADDPAPYWSPVRAGLAAAGFILAVASALLIGVSLGEAHRIGTQDQQAAPAPDSAAPPAGTPDEDADDAATDPTQPVTRETLGGRATERDTAPRRGTQTQPQTRPDNLAARTPTVDEAIDALREVIDVGLQRDAIRRDVALDLQQMLTNLRTQRANGAGDVENTVDELRRKVTSRAAENAIDEDVVRRLNSALDTLDRAR